MAVKRIQKGEEIFNDYGILPSSDLLRRYGYISDEYKKWDVVELRTETLVRIVLQDTGITANDSERRVRSPEVLGLALADAGTLGCVGSRLGVVGGDFRHHPSSRE